MEPPNTRRKYVGCNATVTWHPPSPKNKIKWHTSKNIVSEYSQYTGHCWRNENGKKKIKHLQTRGINELSFLVKAIVLKLLWHSDQPSWSGSLRHGWGWPDGIGRGCVCFEHPLLRHCGGGGGADRADIPLDGEWHGGWLSFRWLRSLEIVGVPKREGCGIGSAGSCCRLFCGGAAGCNSVRLRRRTRSPVSTLQELGDMLSTTWP